MLLAGCALSPQQIRVDPELTAVELPPGLDRRVALAVTDARPGTALGSRGGIYSDTAAISTGPGFTVSIRDALAARLTGAGYAVTGPDAAAELGMQVQVMALDYDITAGAPPKKLSVATTLVMTVRDGADEYRGEGKVSRERDVLKNPSATTNEAMVNEVLSMALGDLLGDKRLHAWLQAR